MAKTKKKMSKRILKGAIDIFTENEKLRKIVLGETSNGKARSVVDCLTCEYLSSSDRGRYTHNKKKKHSKH